MSNIIGLSFAKGEISTNLVQVAIMLLHLPTDSLILREMESILCEYVITVSGRHDQHAYFVEDMAE